MLWENIESVIGDKCNSVSEIFEAILTHGESVKQLSQEKENDLKRIASLQEELNSIKTENEKLSVSSITQKKQIEDYLLTINHTRDELLQKQALIKDANKTLLGCVDLLARLDYDKHLTLEEAKDTLIVSINGVLKKSGYSIMNENGIPFDPKYHNVVSITPTDNPDLEDHVAETIRSGIVKDGKCVRAQEVVIYKKSIDHEVFGN